MIQTLAFVFVNLVLRAICCDINCTISIVSEMMAAAAAITTTTAMITVFDAMSVKL